MAEQKQCFVIQGFGKKTDYTNGRVLDLDASYEVIKQGVEDAGLECIRADEIIHSGIIDVPMYERLLNADVVVADLSTYNVNAAFELGVRHALKPHTTIVLAESQFKNPFDLGHIVLRSYKHLGEDGISFAEAKRLMTELKTAILSILDQPQVDSPVYTFLPHLLPPQIKPDTPPPVAAAPVMTAGATEAANLTGEGNPSAKLMFELALQKINDPNGNDFAGARTLLLEVVKLRPQDSYVLQQLALATYKSKVPTEVDALQAAKQILLELHPEICNNPETLGLWGSIHKRLWVALNDIQYLQESINSYERGFYLKQDHYNGINLAFLLNIRAVESLKNNEPKEEALADYIVAKRVRKEVIKCATPLLETVSDPNKEYWLYATLYEAAVGLEDEATAAAWENKAKAMPVAGWMQESRVNQANQLRELMAAYKEKISLT